MHSAFERLTQKSYTPAEVSKNEAITSGTKDGDAVSRLTPFTKQQRRAPWLFSSEAGTSAKAGLTDEQETIKREFLGRKETEQREAEQQKQEVDREKQKEKLISGAISGIANINLSLSVDRTTANSILNDFSKNIKNLYSSLDTKNPKYTDFESDVTENVKDSGRQILADIKEGDRYKVLVAFKVYLDLYNITHDSSHIQALQQIRDCATQLTRSRYP